LKPIDQIVVRPTSDEQKTFIESNILGNKEEDTSADVMEEFESAEDLG
jgi:hypothetical protein